MLEPAFKACPVVQVDEDASAIGFSVLISLSLVEPVFRDEDRVLHSVHALLLLCSRLLSVELGHNFASRHHLSQGFHSLIAGLEFFTLAVIFAQSFQLVAQGAWG